MEDVGGRGEMCRAVRGAVTRRRKKIGEEEQEIKEKEKEKKEGERVEENERWKGLRKCPVRTHRRPMNLNCGISGIQTQSPNGNYQRSWGEGDIAG